MPALTLPYFVSEPDTPNGRGIVVCHEGLGLTTQILRLGERLAGEGYTVVAPDFFFRTGGPKDSDYWESINAITPEQRVVDLATAIEALRGLGATSFGVTGFCLGGGFSYSASKHAVELGVSATVPFYGGMVVDEPGELQCPTLFLYGDADEHIPFTDVEKIIQRHGDAVHVYPGIGHAFMRDNDPESYHADTAADAWRRMLAFFDEHLG
jgi:carboxymethylenebutenolidase